LAVGGFSAATGRQLFDLLQFITSIGQVLSVVSWQLSVGYFSPGCSYCVCHSELRD